MAKQRTDTAIYIAYDEYVQWDPARPEKDLLRAILSNALADLRKPGEVSRRARDYMLSTEEDYIFSFNSVCYHLDLDPKTVLAVAGLYPARKEGDESSENDKSSTMSVPELLNQGREMHEEAARRDDNLQRH